MKKEFDLKKIITDFGKDHKGIKEVILLGEDGGIRRIILK